MAFITRVNGSGASSLISAEWFNSIQRVLTGVDADQPIAVKNSLTTQVSTVDPSVACTATVGTFATSNTSALGVGLYQYAYSWVNGDGGESVVSPISSATTTLSLKQFITLTNIVAGPATAPYINLYRSKVGGGTLFFLAQIARTVTSYSDTTGDTALGHPAPISSSYGGSLLLKDVNGNINGIVHQDANGGILSINGKSMIRFEIAGGNTLSGSNRVDMAYIDGQGLHVDGNGAALFINQGFAGPSVSYVVVGANFGVKTTSGTKLFEAKSSGNMIIGGTQYQTSASSIGTASGQSFDSFDVAELFECDQTYVGGAVVCPQSGLLRKCIHDNCPCPMVVSNLPGFLLGASDSVNDLPIAMSGRVNVNTSVSVQARDLLVSDGQGGVRVKTNGEQGYIVGFALNVSANGQVGVFLRSMVA